MRRGARMLAVVGYVAVHPGCTKTACVDERKDYAPVNRAIAAGLIEARRTGPRGGYALYLAPCPPSGA